MYMYDHYKKIALKVTLVKMFSVHLMYYFLSNFTLLVSRSFYILENWFHEESFEGLKKKKKKCKRYQL